MAGTGDMAVMAVMATVAANTAMEAAMEVGMEVGMEAAMEAGMATTATALIDERRRLPWFLREAGPV